MNMNLPFAVGSKAGGVIGRPSPSLAEKIAFGAILAFGTQSGAACENALCGPGREQSCKRWLEWPVLLRDPAGYT